MSNVDLENIWDAPAEQASTSKTSAPIDIGDDSDGDAPSSSRIQKRVGLFFSDDSDAEAPAPTALKRPDIDALFENIDEPEPDAAFLDLAPALDLSALRREADARNARAARAEFGGKVPTATAQQQNPSGAKKKGKGKGKDVLGEDGDGDGDDEDAEAKKKKRKPLPRMDETRLLGKDGFPQLIKDTKHWKPKGKGYEAVDLDRVLQTYQFWAHKMYPKTKFRDTVERVEKLCHSKRMHVALSVWRDEANGLINGIDPSTLEPDEDADADGASDSEVIDLTEGATARLNSSPHSSRNSSPAPTRTGPRVVEIDDEDDLFSSPARKPSLPPITPSPGPSTSYSDDFDMDILDMDALLAEEAATVMPAPTPTTHVYTSKKTAPQEDDDDAMWDALEMEAALLKPPPKPPARVIPDDEDEDMWDLVREAEEQEAAASKPSAPTGARPKPTSEEGWDDMYL